jgi:hypothetical protein
MPYLKVEGHENLYRDASTGAIINKEIKQNNPISTKIHDMVDDINNLKNELHEIKSLLKLLTEKY